MNHAHAARTTALSLLTLALAACSGGPASDAPAESKDLVSRASPERLSEWHDLFSTEPHAAGTPGDAAMIANLVAEFEAMGLDVEIHRFWAYLGRPVDASVQVVTGEGVDSPIDLSIREAELDSDPFSANPEHAPGWNAYSGSGDVTARVVYANYGRLEDFRALEELGIDLDGAIVIARYGGNFRGYKAKYAQEAGAAGLVIYTDPADDRRGASWPDGGWANGSNIQRGSIKTLPYAGDPLTPFFEATKDAQRLAPEEVGLPTIPVQPIGWDAAAQILTRMTGEGAESLGLEGWAGGVEGAPYSVEGGDELRVRLLVEQERNFVESANVIATLPGKGLADEIVVAGCHHDAWGYGASDPNAGIICLLEAAHALANGPAPWRTIKFCAWGAEEHGIIGSTEWVEANRDLLSARAIAYINLDMAAMGPDFRCSASPSLMPAITEATRRVRTAGGQGSVYDAWNEDDSPRPPFGDLGGGSDHVAFLCHVGVPSAGLGARGARGVSYHTMYDNLAWYRAVVGEDYESARMVSDVATETLRILSTDRSPLAPSMYGSEAARQLDRLSTLIESRGTFGSSQRESSIERLAQLAERAESIATTLKASSPVNGGAAVAADRAWIDKEGLPGRPWFRNLYAAPDETSGYASWMLPGLRRSIENGDYEAFKSEADRIDTAFDKLEALAAN